MTAWLRDTTRPGEVLDAVLAGDAAHHVAGLPGEPEPVPLLLALPAIRRTGATSVGLALAVPGHLAGLGGPPAFNKAVLEVGEAVVLEHAGLGLVPHRAGAGVVWQAHPAGRRQLPDVGEASRRLRAVLNSATTRLASLDLARWSPEVADELMNLRHRPAVGAPQGVPEQAVALASRAQTALAIVELALDTGTDALTADATGAARAALAELASAAREAWVAAASPEGWPPPL